VVFPLLCLPLLAALLTLLVASFGRSLFAVTELAAALARITGTGLVLLAAAIAVTNLWRWFRS
jgi:uncharacterized membrane protein